LLGEYFRGVSWDSEPAYRQIDPIMDIQWEPRPPLVPPDWYARWMGYIEVEKGGRYAFRLERPNPIVLRIDGSVVLDTNRGGGEAPAVLGRGLHVLDIRYWRGGPTRPMQLQLSWKPPGEEEFEVVPYGSLRPFVGLEREGTAFARGEP